MIYDVAWNRSRLTWSDLEMGQQGGDAPEVSLETIIQARFFELDLPRPSDPSSRGAGGSVLPWGPNPRQGRHKATTR